MRPLVQTCVYPPRCATDCCRMKSLHRKIEVSYLVLVGITVAISTFSAYHFSKLGTSTRYLLQDNYRSVQAAENMVKALAQQEIAQLTMLSGRVDEGWNDFLSSRNEFLDWYEEVAYDGRALAGEGALLDSVSITYDQYRLASDSLYRLVTAGNEEMQEHFRDSILMWTTEELRYYVKELLRLHQNAMMGQQAEVEGLADAATKAVVAASVLAVILSLISSLQFVQQIVRPIEHLTNSVRRIGRGALSEQIEITTQDEIAELGREFNKMTDRLAKFEAMNVQKLIAEKKKTESLVAALPNPVIMTDRQDRVLLLNQAAIEILQAHDVGWLEKPLPEISRNDSLTQHLDGADQADDELDPVLPVSLDGSTRYFRRRLVAINSPEGQLELKVILLEDVTHFKELDQLKSDFLAAVSHELRTPLTSLAMAIDLLQQEVPGPLTEFQQDLLETASEDNERLKKFVEALLALARLEAGMFQPERLLLDFDSVVQQATSALRLPFSQAGVKLEISIEQDISPIQGDQEQLGWVVTNLVGNALRHTPEGGRVRISVFAEDDQLHVTVTDTGSGIPKESLEIIFDKFVQVKGTMAPGGAGLGLSIAKTVIEAHGGRIWAESELGQGSTFHFMLPLYVEEGVLAE